MFEIDLVSDRVDIEWENIGVIAENDVCIIEMSIIIFLFYLC